MGSPMENIPSTPIQRFYSRSNVFITGATGFFGRVLLEKLLRSCPDISKIYILTRQKRGADSRTRAMEMLDDVLFQRLREERPNFKDKVVGIDGDCSLPNLGLNSSDMEMLKSEVTIIFHLAATINFMEKLKTATFINVRAARDILRLAQGMPNLKVLMHVSTAYANCIRDVMEETIYPAAFNGDALISMAEHLPDRIFDKISDALLGKYPNTYTFTKQIAEGLMKENGTGMPIGIHRPAVTISTYKEPMKSWNKSAYSATGLVTYAGLGVVRTLYGDPTCKSNVVPVDMCINSLIAAAWDVSAAFKEAEKQKRGFEIPVYHYESNSDNPIAWGPLFHKTLHYASATPSSKTVWFHCFNIHSNLYLQKIYKVVLHIIPGFIVDLASVCFGKPPIMLKMYTKLHKLNEVLAYFSDREFEYKSNNVKKLIGKMSDKDREIFFSDLRQLDWNEFMKTYFYGIRLYVLKDPKETIPEARKKWHRLYWAHQFLSLAFGFLLLWLMWILLKKKLHF